ncbi:MAG: SDR family oxidoreductase [Acidobacteriota bacterium]|nr:MAG: SDR family oxidoreductase [Acidobacteriota bacterium]
MSAEGRRATGVEDRVALVTAASSGIGLASARALARAGGRVAILSRDERRLAHAREQVRGTSGADVVTIAGDLDEPVTARRALHAAAETLGPVEIVVANVGGPPPGTFDDLDDAAWDRAVRGVLLAAVRLTREALSSMRQRRYGRIVHVLSVTVRTPIIGLTTSNALRPAVAGLIADLARENAPHGITVNGVCPGYTRTPRIEQLGAQAPARLRALEAEIPAGRLADPDEIAAAVLFLASEQASYVNGVMLPVDGALTARPQ